MSNWKEINNPNNVSLNENVTLDSKFKVVIIELTNLQMFARVKDEGGCEFQVMTYRLTKIKTA